MGHSFKLELLRATISLDDIPDIPDNSLIGPPAIARASLISCVNDVRVNFASREYTGISGETVAPLTWDHITSDRSIDSNSSCNIAVSGELTPFMWEIKADGFFLDAGHLTQSGETAGVSRTLYCDSDAYGSCAIKVTDNDDNVVFGYVACTREWI